MLNNEKKKKALAEREKAVEQYNSLIKTFATECELLYDTRKQTVELIKYIEDFLLKTTDSHHQFDPSLQRIKIEYTKFRHTEDYVAAESKKQGEILSFSVALGVEAWKASAQIAPKATMLFATTFGKASTGTPVSILSGAAQNKAALAWLGGGAKRNGGGGIAAGQDLLASPMPSRIGFIVSGVVIAGVALFALDRNNRAIAEQAREETNAAKITGEKLIETHTAIALIHSETEALLARVHEQFKIMEPLKDSNYADLSNDEQLQIESLVNNTIELAEMLNKVVE